ncbi:MAG: 3-phosphoshikimate 1-carboxyvinyltransferase [Candidatus Thermoplasmatota archaeon]
MKPNAVQIRPGRVGGRLHAPPSKSETHRAYLLAARSDEPCRVRFPLKAEDTQATLSCLHDLGARLHLQDEDVQFLPAPFRSPRQPLDCRNSGTTLRLLTAMAATLPYEVTLTGDDSLRTRPNGALLDALRSLGARCDSVDGRAPLTIRGPVRAGAVTLPPGASSQFASALVLALAAVPGISTVQLTAPLASSPYLDVTLQVAAEFGLRIHDSLGNGRRLDIEGGIAPHASRFNVAGDWSAAAFPLVAAAITGGSVTVTGVLSASHQGDRAIIDHLRAFGADAKAGEDTASCAAAALASPGTVDVSQTPDLFPALCVLAAASRGTTTFVGASALRHKESDRITAMATGLARMGVAVAERPDGLVVTGGNLQGASLASAGDHRIHMALAVAALAANGPSTLDDPGCVAVSWPGFHKAMLGLDASLTLLYGNRAEVAS